MVVSRTFVPSPAALKNAQIASRRADGEYAAMEL
jgi:hypothetical protein